MAGGILTPEENARMWWHQLASFVTPPESINLYSAVGQRNEVQALPGIGYAQGHSNINVMNALYRDAFYAAARSPWGH